ncbi:MAG: UbiA prenyltransferase family protein [Armatimonadetes bacterium]|nr:UbiA prenyltransferase family protein [Candidatus Hippobium faecium]
MDYIKLLRPTHWIKNLILFIPLIFASAFNIVSITTTIVGFLAFSLIASCVYIINDIKDYEKDKSNPHKNKRPIASDRVSKRKGIYIFLICFIAACLICAMCLPKFFIITLGIYFLLNIAYIFKLKNIVIIDVLCLSISSLLRIVAGGFLANVEVTKWLLVTIFFLALFLGFTKRRGEIAQNQAGIIKREVALIYSLNTLDNFIVSTGMLAVICYALFTLDNSVIEKFSSPHLFCTIPFPVYGIFRYIMIIPKTDNTDPTNIFYSDLNIVICVVLWVVLTFSVIHFHL